MKVVAKVLILDSKNRMLILERSGTHPEFPHHFDLPGGEVELNEDTSQAVSREIYEETGLKIPAKKIKLLFNKKINNNLHHLLLITKINKKDPNLSISWEHCNSFWLTKTELLGRSLPKNADSYYKNVIDYLGSIDWDILN